MNNFLGTRSLIELNLGNLPKVYAPQAVIVKASRADGMFFRVDIGRICYLEREDSSGCYPRNKNLIVKGVSIDSLSKERVKWLRNYLDIVFRKGWRNETLRQELHCVRYFFDFCDFNGGSQPITLDELVMEYQRYQLVLGQRGRMNGQSSLKVSSISKRLNTARSFIQWAFELSNNEILAFIPKHRSRQSQIENEFRLVTMKDGQEYLRACAMYFNQFCDAILENRYPVSVTPPNSSISDLYWHAPWGTSLKSLPGCFNKSGDPLPLNSIGDVIAKNFKNRNDGQKGFYIKTLIHQRDLWMEGKLTPHKIYAYNLSTFCFFQLYIGFTAANVQPTLDLKISDIDLSKIGSNAFAKKHKFRAGRMVSFTAPSQLKREIVKYLKLREWAEGLTCAGNAKEYLFVSISKGKKLNRLDRSSGAQIIRESPLFEGVTQITSRDIRQLAGEFLIRKSQGKITLVAKKLNNSLATTARSYTAIDIETQAQEMNAFHEELAIQVRQFNRNTKNSIPVKLSGEEDSERIPIGSCTNKSGDTPRRAKGFNVEAPEPVCGTFESCLFCEHYAMHKDFEDIHKLLSLREALRFTSVIRNDSEHHEAVVQPALFRIDEIVEFLIETDEKLIEVINKVEEELEMGNYNKNWSKQIAILAQHSGNLAGRT